MSVFSKVCECLSEYEDDDLWKTYWKLYGPLPQLSLLFPSFRPPQRLLTLTLIVMYIILFPGHFILLAISFIKERNNFSLFSLLVHYGLLMLYGMFAIFFFSVPNSRKSNAVNHRILSSDIGKYQHGRIYEENTPLKIEKDLDRQFMQILIIPGFVGLGAGILFFLPYMNNFNTGISYSDAGVNLNLPIPVYYPFHTNKGVGHFVAVGAQLGTAGGLAIVIMTSVLLLLRVSQRLRLEYKVLNYALDTLFERASIIYKKQDPHKGEAISVEDPLYQYCIGECLRDCVVHHHNIVKLMGGFENVTRWPAVAAYGIGCVGIALSLLNILTAMSAADHEKLIMFFVLGTGEVTNLLMLSVIGEAVTSESKELRERLYNIKWYDIDIKNRKLMLNFQVGVTEPVIMKAGVNLDICLDTFSSIMNTAYSFFNLVNANME